MIDHNTHIVFRVDASRQIGTGHFMRCLSLAIGLKKLGSNVLFVSRHLADSLAILLDDNEILLARIESQENRLVETKDEYSEWLGVSQNDDAQATLDILSGRQWDWLIVDHYSLDQAWESLLRKEVSKIMVIDDLANRQHDCDLLLDQNFHPDHKLRYRDKVPQGCLLLLGPKYALLREEFQRVRQNLHRSKSEVSRILVFFGGVDFDDYTSKTIEALSTISEFRFQVDVIIGSQHPNKDNILGMCHRHGYSCHVQTNKMAELIAKADIGIGAGGSATWERCTLGLPTITIAVAENQKQLTYDAANAGIVYAPEFGADLVHDFKMHVEAFIRNPILRMQIAHKGMEVLDGNGVKRVLRTLYAKEIELRVVTDKDINALFGWRNHSSIRMVSRETHLIPWKEHQAWFENILNRRDVQILIGYMGEQNIGVVRFNFYFDTSEISIYLIPDEQESGLGSALLVAAEKWIRKMHPKIKQIKAEVMENNPRSRQFFINNGYTAVSSILLKSLIK